MADLKKGYTDEDLREMLLQNGSKEEDLIFFIKRYEIIYSELSDSYKDPFDLEIFEQERGKSLKDISLNHLFEYFLFPFKEQIQAGHNREWALKYIEDYFKGEENRCLLETYEFFVAKDNEFANKELKVFCKKNNKDDKFYEYLLKQFAEGEYVAYQLGKADKYSKVYKEQIEKGKSELYAEKYADYKAMNEMDIVCYIYADTYEKLILKGKSERYAECFASTYLDNIGNEFHFYYDDFRGDRDKLSLAEIEEQDRWKNWFYQNALSEVYASDYAYNTRLEDKDKFIEKYKGNYFNIYSENRREKNDLSEDQLHEIALKATLDEFERLGYK